MRLRYLLRHIDERLVEPDTELLSVSKTHGVAPRAEISDTPGRADDLSNYKTCQVNDLVINRMSAYQGALGVAGQFGAISPDYMVLRMTDAIRPGFAGYLFKSHFMISEMSSRVKGIGSVDSGSVRTPRLNWSDLGQVEVDLPPADQQESIAGFLDRETAKIDALIAKQEELVTTLDERRGAVISRAVTRGLFEDRPFRKSGVEWLGEIPEDWLVKPLKRNTYIKARVGWKGLTSDEFEVDSFAYLVTGRDFSSKVIDFSECYQVSQERYLDDPFIQLKQGDILITKDGTIGKTAWVNELDKPACLNSGIFVVRPKADYVSEFLFWVLESAVFKEFIRLVSSGSTIQHLYQNVFENFSFGIPPVEEQRRIADFLDRETARFDHLRAEATRMIRLLADRRQALISAAVTGKLEVVV